MWCFLFPLQFRRGCFLGGAFPSFFGVVLPFLVFSSFVFVSFFDHFSFLSHCCFLFFLFEGLRKSTFHNRKGCDFKQVVFSASQDSILFASSPCVLLFSIVFLFFLFPFFHVLLLSFSWNLLFHFLMSQFSICPDFFLKIFSDFTFCFHLF